jgi:hypothetical protein
VIKLKPRYFYLRAGGAFYKGLVPEVKDPYMSIEFPQIRPTNTSENQDGPIAAPALPAAPGIVAAGTGG